MSIVFAFLCCCAMFAANSDASKLTQISFLHRHGARIPPIFIDGELRWKYATLTAAGGEMGRQLGVALRSRYPSFIPNTFDEKLYTAVSTDYSRTIQTGFAVLSTLFNNANGSSDASIPYLSHVPEELDYLLAFPGNFPARMLTSSFWNAYDADNDKAREILGANGTRTLLNHYQTSWCEQHVMLCALYAEDEGQCLISNGGMPSDLLSIFPKLLNVQMYANKIDFGVNASSPFFAAGSPGFPLANKWLRDAEQSMTAMGGNASGPQVFHYSAHDNTVVGLYVAFGAIDDSIEDSVRWVPRFTETVLMESYDNGTVALYKGLPDEEAGSGFSFRFYPLTVRCESANGTVTNTSNLCLLNDLWRYVNRTSKPSAPEIVSGQFDDAACWLPDAFRGLCDVLDGTPSIACAQYRQSCPTFSCQMTDQKSVLDVTTGECLTFVGTSFSHNAAPSILSACGALVLGVVIGFLISKVVEIEEVKFPEEKSYLQNVEEEEEAVPDEEID